MKRIPLEMWKGDMLQIIIEGSNGRGMAFGLLELSRLAGVSPKAFTHSPSAPSMIILS